MQCWSASKILHSPLHCGQTIMESSHCILLMYLSQLLKASSFWLRSARLASMPSSSIAVLCSYSTNQLPAQAPPPSAIRCSQGCRIRGTLRRALLYMLIPKPMHPPKNAPETIFFANVRVPQVTILGPCTPALALKTGSESLSKSAINLDNLIRKTSGLSPETLDQYMHVHVSVIEANTRAVCAFTQLHKYVFAESGTLGAAVWS